MSKVIVGMSGGVDSAVAAYLLKQAGHDVAGVTLRTWQSSSGEESRCCEIDDARETARIIGIPYYVFNCTDAFENRIIKPFIDKYIHGMTPNPCVICNREIKWERLLYYSKVLGAEFVATGHYASIIKLDNGRYTVGKAIHEEKDQAYMLYRLTQDQLKKTLMPLGALSKQEVRDIANKAGIQVASKPDSQEICFVTDGDYADFISRNSDAVIPGEGCFVDESGKILGKHKGIIHYTVGQRKGLGIALGYPAYIKKINADTNEIVLGTTEETGCKAIICNDLNFMSIAGLKENERINCPVKIRYRHQGQSAVLVKDGDYRIRVEFDKPVRSAAPGQSAVFYDKRGFLIGGGIITEAI